MSLYQNFFRWNYKFIGYLHNHDKVKPLNIMPPKTSAYVSYDEQIKWMCFFIEDDQLFRNITLLGIK